MTLRHPVARFLLAAVAAALTTWANVYLQALTAGQAKTLPYFPALVIVTYFAGLYPAVLFVVLAAFALDYLWLDPTNHWSIAGGADVYVLAFFLLASAVIITVSEAARRLVAELRLGESRLDAARAASAAAEQRFRVALEGSSVLVWSCDRDRRLNWIYDPQQSPLDDMLGTLVPGKLPGHESPEYARAIDRAWLRGRPQALTVRSTQQGKVRHHLAHIDPIKDSSGGLLGLVGSSVDVTALHEAEETIRLSEENFSKAFAASPDALAIIASSDGTLLEVNPHFLSLFGVERTEVVGRCASEFGFVDPGDISGTALRDRPLQISRRSGERRDVRVTTETLRVAGRAHTLAIVRDVSEQTRMDAALRESEESLRLALEGAQLGMWVRDLHTGYTAGTARYYEILGLPPDAEPLSLERWCLAIHPDDLQGMIEAGRMAIVARGSYERQFRLVRPDGSIRWAESRARVSCDERDVPNRLVGILMDITDRKETETALRESSRRKDEFLAILAHELRNPLAPVRYASRLFKAEISPAQTADLGDMIERQLAHMARLLDDLLDTSRISRGVLELRREPLDLRCAIQAAVDATEPHRTMANQTLIAQISPTPLPVDGDRVRLTQALGNLLDNASKYSDGGAPIEIEARASADEIIVEVRDHGIGIPPELLPRIFELFTQGDRGHSRSTGLGIGLALAQQLVKLHDGKIEAHSAGTGHGSRFVLKFPRRAELPSLAAGDDRPRTTIARAARGLKILIVDDNTDGADALSRVLEIAGHSTKVAYEGFSGLGLAETFRPEIALLDIGMPNMSGLELARRIRAQPWGATMRLIAVTGWGQPSDRRRSADAGFDQHLTKPVDPDQLLETISRYAEEITSEPHG